MVWVKSSVQQRVLLAVEQGHPAVLPGHCSEGGAGTLQTPALCSCRGTGKTHSFCFRGEVKNRAQDHQSNCYSIFYSCNSVFCYWLLLCSATRQMLLHEDLKMVYRVFVESGEGRSTCDCCRSSCGGLRHRSNVLWARVVGDGASSPSFPLSQQ